MLEYNVLYVHACSIITSFFYHVSENDFPKMASVHVSIETSFVRLNALNFSTV